MALATTDLGFRNVFQRARAGGVDLDALAETEESREHACFEDQVCTRVRHQDTRHTTFGAKLGCVDTSTRCALNQPAFLDFTSTMEVFVVVGALCSCGCSHSRLYGRNSGPCHVGPTARVDSNGITGFDEEWYLNLESGLGGNVFIGAGGGVTFDRHFRFDDF